MIIYWFRQDLRLADNPALREAVKHGKVLPIYILDDENAAAHKMGGASRCWLYHALAHLNAALEGQLSLYCGDAIAIFNELVQRHLVEAVYWNRCYEPWRIKRDQAIEAQLVEKGITVKHANGSLLWEPWEIAKADGTPYKVFTPFFRQGCLKVMAPRTPLPAIKKADWHHDNRRLSLAQLNLLPRVHWDKSLLSTWAIGERAAQTRLKKFLKAGLTGYQVGRNFPAEPHVSRLSPHLHFGEISPNQVWYAVQHQDNNPDVEQFLSELGWREFSYYLLYHFPQLPRQNLQPKFNRFPWRKRQNLLACWQQGQTGYPIVDAGMRELWQTGYMHNRVRMIVGSFLVKNLLLHWRQGESWFFDCLLDADLANNSASWQWVAGCGADAAPYFRIFNPVTQGEKFDPAGHYTRHFVKELSQLPQKYLFAPWEAPSSILQKAGIRLGETYPHPIVELKPSREAALAAFASLNLDSAVNPGTKRLG